jgi:DNA-binding protein H-NS
MPKTLLEVRQQIEGLKAIEAKLRREEAQGVIARIREAISVYELTPDDLFGTQPPSVRAKSAKTKVVDARFKYSDGQGNTWSGRGRRPLWIAAAIDNGASVEQFEVGAKSKLPTAETPAKAARKSKPPAKKAVAIKYRDGESTWSGRGSQPRWLKAGLAEGKRLEDFAV